MKIEINVSKEAIRRAFNVAAIKLDSYRKQGIAYDITDDNTIDEIMTINNILESLSDKDFDVRT